MATPAVRRLGMEHGIDLNHIRGTGPKGRVLKADLLKLLDGKDRFQTSADTTTTTTTSSSSDISKALESSTSKEVPLRGYNRLMVKAMTASLQIPHMCYSDEVNMNALRKTREELLPLVQAKHGIAKLSYLPFCLKAASLAMKDYPVINASFKDGDNPALLYHADHNIGVAMDTPRGLVVPVIHRCQELSILDICNELIRLQTLVRFFCYRSVAVFSFRIY
jgi:2-oxoisovalerate dehydrogenase E2 component (dihydrolipoyl transacylase)